jgi:hypothetical protein
MGTFGIAARRKGTAPKSLPNLKSTMVKVATKMSIAQLG